MKPKSWDEEGRVVSALLVLKWGGGLSPAGKRQAESLGARFRKTMYPQTETEHGADDTVMQVRDYRFLRCYAMLAASSCSVSIAFVLWFECVRESEKERMGGGVGACYYCAAVL